jgi:hypothetical protein
MKGMRKLLLIVTLFACLAAMPAAGSKERPGTRTAQAGIITTGDGLYCDTETGYCCDPRKGECGEGFVPSGNASSSEPPEESESLGARVVGGLLEALGF